MGKVVKKYRKVVKKNRISLFQRLNRKLTSMSGLEEWCESQKMSLSELCCGYKLETKHIYVSFVEKFKLKNVPRNRNLCDQLINVVVARSVELQSVSAKMSLEKIKLMPKKRGNKSHNYNVESCSFNGFEMSGLPKFNSFYDKQISPRNEGIFKVS